MRLLWMHQFQILLVRSRFDGIEDGQTGIRFCVTSSLSQIIQVQPLETELPSHVKFIFFQLKLNGAILFCLLSSSVTEE